MAEFVPKVSAQVSLTGHDDVDVTIDPVSGLVYGPPDAIEAIGPGTLVFNCNDGAGDRTFNVVLDRETFEDTGATVVRAASTVTGLRLRWRI